MRHGTVMSLRGTASGLLFAAPLPPARVRELLAQEPHGGRRTLDAAFSGQLATIRSEGLSRVVDGTVPGVSAMAAPVFDLHGELVLSLAAIGPNATFDTQPAGPLARALKACAAGLSRQLGAAGIVGG
jgi:DNA-binding IclR family transcriptional regulator